MRQRTVEQTPKSVPRISIDDVKALMAKKQVVVVDVRDKVSFATSHVPGAMNIVFDDIPNYIERLEKDKRQIVIYCA
ncbi:MAG TPA: rhodanese-like domain-containing protein [Vicinamibacterales bacterium]|nr:rhodanese-like domain-containing protein [Vicinamibacterales bacterium]